MTSAWVRLDVRRRWRPLAVLALLVAVSSGTVLAAMAGARRGDSAVQRLAARTLPATAVVLPNQPGFDWDAVRAIPEVETLSTFLLGMEFSLAEIPAEDNAVGFPPGDAEFMRSIERPVVFEGRLADPRRADEAVVTPAFVKSYRKGVGDTVTALLFSPAQVQAAGADQDPGAPRGPRLPIRIVGVVRSFWGLDEPGSRGGLAPSAGLFAQYRSNIWNEESSYANALVRLRGGEAALPAFQAHLAEVTGRSDIDVWNQPAQIRDAQRSFSFQARCLMAFGAAALIAALFLVGQAVARYTAASVADLRVLRALGMTPRQTLRAAAAGPFLAALAGATGGVAAACLASRWFPIGSAAAVEPAPGLDFDWLVLGSGWVVVPAFVLAGSAAAAWLALGAGRLPGSGRSSSLATAVARAGLPVPVVVGTRFALETGRGRTAVPVRPALFGAVAGVLGILAAFTFSSGVTEAAANPVRFGQTWQLETFAGLNGQDFVPSDLFTAVARDPDVAGFNDTRIAVAHAGSNGTAVSMYTHDPIGTPIHVVLTSGRLPSAASEVALAPSSALALDARPGSRIAFTGSKGRRTLTVVGIGFVPPGPHNDYDSGGWMTREGYGALFTENFKFHAALIAIRPGADLAAVTARLHEVAATIKDAQGAEFTQATPPTQVVELREVRVLPVALGIFLVLLAVGAVGHALATAVRRRRHDLAVLRALGMTRWQSRGVVVTQATVLALVGLVLGVPLGVALGRTLWRVVADYTPLQYYPPLALWALLLVAPLTLLVANLLAAWPGRQAARLRVAHVLRAE